MIACLKTLLIIPYGPEYGRSQVDLSLLRGHETLFVAVAHETQLDQNTGHGSLPQHQKTGLFNPPVAPAYPLLKLVLNNGSRGNTLIEVNVLHQFKYDVRLGGIGIEALVLSAVVLFQNDDRVLLF